MRDNPLIMTNPNGHTNTLPLYYPVAMPKFILMFIITLGLYGLFWWYKTWKAMGKSTFNAIIRAVFIYLTIGPFVDDLKQHLDAAGINTKFNPKALQFIYLGYFVLAVSQHIYSYAMGHNASTTLVGIMVLLKLLLAIIILYTTFYLVKLVNHLNIALNNEHLIDKKYTLKSFIGIGICVILVIGSLWAAQ